MKKIRNKDELNKFIIQADERNNNKINELVINTAGNKKLSPKNNKLPKINGLSRRNFMTLQTKYLKNELDPHYFKEAKRTKKNNTMTSTRRINNKKDSMKIVTENEDESSSNKKKSEEEANEKNSGSNEGSQNEEDYDGGGSSSGSGSGASGSLSKVVNPS